MVGIRLISFLYNHIYKISVGNFGIKVTMAYLIVISYKIEERSLISKSDHGL